MFDSNFIANPYEYYRRLREAAPLHWMPDFYRGAWLAPRHADVAAGLLDARLSSRRSGNLTAALPGEVQGEFVEFNEFFAKWMLFLDAPQHTRLRKLVNPAFLPQMVNWLRPRIERLVDDLLDAVENEGAMEFIADFAHPLPVRVIAEMMGVPRERHRDFQKWSDALCILFGNPRPSVEMARAARDSLFALTEYFRAALPARRLTRGDDLISLLIGLEEDGDALTEEELLAQCSMFFFGGHETTRNLIGNGMLALLQNPDQFEMLRENPSLAPSAVREFARFDSPVQMTVRNAAEDLVWHDREIRKGQSIALLLGSANRDPEKFSEPDRLDITRAQSLPLSFGRGAHFCIGATLANAEAEIAFTKLLERFPNLKMLDPEPQWTANISFRGLRALPLGFRRKKYAPPFSAGTTAPPEIFAQ